MTALVPGFVQVHSPGCDLLPTGRAAVAAAEMPLGVGAHR